MPSIRLPSLVALVLAAGTSIAVAAPTEPARAAVGNVRPTLGISAAPGAPVKCKVTVVGYVSMSQAEAQGLIASGHRIVVRVWGEDPVVEDSLVIGPRLARLEPTARGLDFRYGVLVDVRALNEDRSAELNKGDEIYAGVRLLNPVGETIRKAETGRLAGNFEKDTCANAPFISGGP